ncbi:MAG: hypothetical protein RBT68_14710 [Spirochaetia bacterium]|jgi:hypothetical protein|nr:hypothetical protein [Spirochaetia bacterium]
MKNRILMIVVITFGLLPMIGSATIMKGGEQNMSFTSDPKDAPVSVYNSSGIVVAGGRTPITLPISRGDGYFKPGKYRVVFEAPGYSPKEIWLTGSLEAGWYLVGNLFLSGWIGWLVVDPITGAMWNLKPSVVSANLDPSLAEAPTGSLQVILASEVSAELLALADPIEIPVNQSIHFHPGDPRGSPG